jgi:molecular chaperone DnaJ
MLKNFYLILGINPNSSPGQIKQAYRRIVKQLHPDITPCNAGSEKFLEAREAYETLADEAKRRRYDAQLAEQAPAPRISRPPTPIGSRQGSLAQVASSGSRFKTLLGCTCV